MAILDQHGNPVDLAALKKPAAPRPPNLQPKPFNPDPASVVAAFKKADQGDPRDLHELAREVRRRDGHIGGQLRNRTRAVTRLPFKVEAVSDDDRDVEVAEVVKRDIVDAPFFRQLLSGLLDATLRGYAVCSLTWEFGEVWRPVAADLADPRDTIIDPVDGKTVRWRDPDDQTKGRDIKPFTAVVHASGDTDGPLWGRGLQYSLAVYYSIKRLGVAAWAAFVELFGVARPVGSYPVSWEQTQIDDFDARLAAWAHAGRLVLPSGASVTFPAPSQNASEASHSLLAEFCNSESSKAILGQTMTSDNGSSRAQAEVHERVADWILEADSLDVCATVEEQLVRAYVFLNYGPDVPVPKLRPQIEDKGLREFKLTALKELVPLGMEVEQSVARDLAGFPEPAAGAKILRPATASAPPAGQVPEAERSAQAVGRERPQVKPVAGHAQALKARASRDEEHADGGDVEPGVGHAQEIARRAGFAEADETDIIDRDGGAAADAGWRPGMQPFVDAVKETAAEVDSFDDFLARLRARQVDGDAFVKSVAAWTMKARGLGDGTDET